MNKIKKQKKEIEEESSSDESDISSSTQNEKEDANEVQEQEEENLVEQKDEVYKKIKSKLEILDIIFHPSNDNLIYLGLINGKLKIYDLSKDKKRLVSAHKLHKKSIRKISTPENNNDLIFTASKDKSIKLTDLKQESTVLTLEKAHESPINCLATIDNWLISTADDEGVVKLWDYRRKTAVMESKDCSDYISDLAVSKDKKILLATSGEGTLSAFHTKKKKMVLQSELMDSEFLSVAFMKNDKKVICGNGEGVINIFNYNEWGNMSDRFPGHPSSIDCLLPLSEDIVLTGCFDGNIRACSIFPNRFLGVLGNHDGFPIQRMCLSNDGNVCASISHDNSVKFWNVENIKSIKLNASSKSKSKSLKNKKITSSGKSENFFADLIDKDEEEEEEDDSDDSDDDDDSDDTSDDDDD